ncbi:preprotein translocase subunit SecE [Glaesserella parasuis]|uniref:Protein translocase subunit SecE n=1 Tax=Glaesserella parasuis TaxID=738 RepID=A0A6I5WPA2_GLAPU|nr:preprotein translocase subunit SecE [Glaesserella parasuis]ATW44583.1 preprotein translocase subunit SecE [Glaesserella parasuis str. Nagasaki]AWY44739.1 preprotein translocase subunit SecE [Glaesserella parasuis 29755]EQA00547.1 preprotein translocase, SecE subunit [Glaesserella parasuis str. Nagasaki]EQA07691.1 preprotein translocase, SecE subunit [Glaesserella parasuis 84-15995]EYE71989.1 preprotein translocase subunit SecE [Glaesserella parasuis str. Nagasaki]
MAKEIQNITLDKVEKGVKSKGINNVLWVFSISLLTIAAIGNTYFAEYFSLIVRILLLVVLCVAALGVAAMTNQGQQSIGFIKDSRQELRKIIWPNRQETTQTTLMVVAMCVVVALALWGIDSIIVLIIDFLTNLRF